MSSKLPDTRSILHRRFLNAQAELLAPDVAHVISPQAPLTEAIRALLHVPQGCVLISEHNALVGIFTERDLLVRCGAAGKLAPNAKVAHFMTKNPQVLKSNASVARLLHMMSSGGFRHVPIQGPRVGELRLVSTKNFVDFIHQSVSKKLVNAPESCVVDDNQVDLLFMQNASVLKPTPTICVEHREPIAAVIREMAQKNLGSIIVQEKHAAGGARPVSKILGIFTERDFLIKVAAKENIDLYTTAIGEVMTPTPKTALESASVAYLFNLMSEGGFRHIPVVDAGENPIGMVSIRNFINLLTETILEELAGAS